MLKEYLEKAKDNKKKKEMQERKKTVAKVGASLVVGSVIGLATGILLAPKAGKEVRGDVAEKATGAIQKGKELIWEKKERLAGLKKSIMEKVADGQGKATEIKDQSEGSSAVKEGEAEETK